jgi:hypothetical protein
MKLNKKSTKDNPNFAKVQDGTRLIENTPKEENDNLKETKSKKNPLAKAARVKP